MREGMLYKQVLILLLAISLWSCGKKYVVPDRYLTSKRPDLLGQDSGFDHNKKISNTVYDQAQINKTICQVYVEDNEGSQTINNLKTLGKDLVTEKEFQKLVDSILGLEDEALKELYIILKAIPCHNKARKNVLKAVVSFDRQEIKEIINIIILLHDKNGPLIKIILEKAGEVGRWTQLKFYILKRNLPNDDQALLMKLRKKLKEQKRRADND